LVSVWLNFDPDDLVIVAALIATNILTIYLLNRQRKRFLIFQKDISETLNKMHLQSGEIDMIEGVFSRSAASSTIPAPLLGVKIESSSKVGEDKRRYRPRRE